MKTKRKLSDFRIDPIRQIAFHPEGNITDFQDGGESYLLDVISSVRDRSTNSTEYWQHIKDWPSRYHLSKKRTNLLEAVKDLLPNNARVLEIGSGCGAITRWLGERFSCVDALEGNELRAEITRKRTQDLDSVTVYCGDLNKTVFDKEYDLIILIGVVECLPLYDEEHTCPLDAATSFLSELSASLSDKGMLLVAIENKLGAKYFTGCTEDHTGHAFESLIGYPDKSPVTFSRNELQSILIKSGLSHNLFYHLFPDYKLTDTIIAEKNEVLSLYPYNWIRTPFEDYMRDPLYLFPDALFVKTVTDAGLLWHFSNSFLALASRSRDVKLEAEWLIKKFHNNEERKSTFHHTINLCCKNTPIGTQYEVIRKPINDGAYNHNNEQYSFELKSSEFVSGDLLVFDLIKALFKQFPDEEIIKAFSIFHQSLIDQYSTGECDQDGYQLVNGNALDYTFWNVIKNKLNGGFIYIDRKWSSKQSIPVDFVIFRNIYYSFDLIRPFIESNNKILLTTAIMRIIFPEYTYERMTKIICLEEDFQEFTNISYANIRLERPFVESFFGIPSTYNLFQNTVQTHLYVNIGNGFSEQQLLTNIINNKKPITTFSITFDLSEYENIKSLRWDPIEGQLCTININKIQIKYKNGTYETIQPQCLEINGDRLSNNIFFFNTIDPWIIIPVEGSLHNITIIGTCQFKKVEDIIDQLSTWDNHIHALKIEIENRDNHVTHLNQEISLLHYNYSELSIELNQIKHSLTWRAVMKFHHDVIEKALPQYTKRRHFYDLCLKGLHLFIHEGFHPTISEYKKYRASQPRKEIKNGHPLNREKR